MWSIINTKTAIEIAKKHDLALISWCFDLLHEWHIDIFRFAKNSANKLLIILMNDESINMSKSHWNVNRPIDKSEIRIQKLLECWLVDYVIYDNEVFSFSSNQASENYKKYLDEIRPKYIVVNKESDNYRNKKKEIAELFRIEVLAQEKKNIDISTTKIIEML